VDEQGGTGEEERAVGHQEPAPPSPVRNQAGDEERDPAGTEEEGDERCIEPVVAPPPGKVHHHDDDCMTPP
jgi:hypothetical protein